MSQRLRVLCRRGARSSCWSPACASSGGEHGGVRSARCPNIPMQKTLGKGEGELNIIAWAGYAEDGSNDPKVDWVTPFEQQTGCKVNVKIGNTSDEMVQLMKTGQYDGVSASGDATLRLIYGGDVAPVNTNLVPNYKTIAPFLKNRQLELGQGSDVRHPARLGRQPADVGPVARCTARSTRGRRCSTSRAPYKGKVTAYDSPIYIADAALYLMSTKPDLGIKDPYSLTEKQLDAAVSCSSSRSRTSASTGPTTPRRSRPSRPGPRGRHDLAGHREHDQRRRQDEGRRPSLPKEGVDRLVGHLDDRGARPSTRTACTSG